MIHFRDYEEYMKFRREREKGEKEYQAEEVKEERKTELVLEDNTIYEIDTSCEKCLKQFWKAKADKNRRS